MVEYEKFPRWLRKTWDKAKAEMDEANEENGACDPTPAAPRLAPSRPAASPRGGLTCALAPPRSPPQRCGT